MQKYWFLIISLMLFFSSFAIAETNDPEANGTDTKDKQQQTIADNSTQNTKASASSKAEEKPTFDIMEYEVVGNSVLAKEKIEEAVYDFMGEAKTIDDVEKARAALEKTYQDAGFLTVSINIPQQDVDKGIVKLEVLEGRVERLRVKDAHYYSLGVIKERVPEFAEGNVPNFTKAAQQLATVNRGANRQVAPILRPGKSPGKVEIDLKVQDQIPLHGSLELNDKYSANTTETRLNGSVRYENLWQRDHSISLSFQVSPQNTSEVKVLSGTYLIPTLAGDYFAAYGVISRSNIAAVGDVNVIGNGNIIGLRYIHPLPQAEGYYHTMTLGADYKDFKESVILLGADGFKTPIAYSAFSATYDGTYQAEQFQTQASAGVSFGVRGLGNKEREFADKRFLAKPNFAALHTDIKHLQKLPYSWALQAQVSGQLTDAPLISAEQFAVGGADSVRGYYESNSLGDSGYWASLELRTPSLNKYIKQSFKELYAYSFVDGGYVKTYNALSGQIPSNHLLSTGLGIKLKAEKGLYADLDYAHVLQTAGQVKNGDDRLHFKLGYEW